MKAWRHHKQLAPELANRPALLGLALAVLAEFFGTAAFVFLATGTVTSGCHTADTARSSGGNVTLENVKPGACFLASSNLLSIALAFGFTIFVLVYACANLSGGHLNPAITTAMLITGKLSVLRWCVYVVAQMLGAIMGSGVLKGIDPLGYSAALGAANRLNTWVSIQQAFVVELLLTSVFVFVVFAAADTKRASSAPHLPVLSPLAIGMTLFICHLVAVPIDGCSVNPARSFGTAVVSGAWDHQWIFWVAPVLGGCIAGGLYELLPGKFGHVEGGALEVKIQAPQASQPYSVGLALGARPASQSYSVRIDPGEPAGPQHYIGGLSTSGAPVRSPSYSVGLTTVEPRVRSQTHAVGINNVGEPAGPHHYREGLTIPSGAPVRSPSYSVGLTTVRAV